MNGRRLEGLDEIRGLMLLLVVLYHLGFDLAVFFGADMPWFWQWPVERFRDGMVAVLMAVSGVSCSLSRSNLKRGLKTLAVALLITAVSAVSLPGAPIWFGVLHCYGLCMILWPVVRPFLARFDAVNAAVWLSVFFAMTRFLSSGYIMLPTGKFFLPGVLYRYPFLFWLGLPQTGFESADYFPLIPWGLAFAAGGVLGMRWRSEGFPPLLQEGRSPFLALVGRHALLVYLLHQPLLLAALWAAFRFF